MGRMTWKLATRTLAAWALITLTAGATARAQYNAVEYGATPGHPGVQVRVGEWLWVDCSRHNAFRYFENRWVPGRLLAVDFNFLGDLYVRVQTDCGNGPQALDFYDGQSVPYSNRAPQ